jgi:hypothetical protein
MRLASVLALKDELKDRPLAAPRALARTLSLGGAPTRAVEIFGSTHVLPSESADVAVGVVSGRGRNDYRLGARIQVGGRRGRALAQEVDRRSRGECDVRIVPRIVKRVRRPAAWFRRRHRPIEAGLSVGHYDITAGTLGFVVEDEDAYYVLSNNHVLANVNAGQPGDPVTQPGPADQAPSARTLIGVLDRFVPLSFRRSNVVDCAVAALLEDVMYHPAWTEALPGSVVGVQAVSVDDLDRPVCKAGRTTGVTRGTITQIDIDHLRVDMGDPGAPRDAVFSNQVEVQGLDGAIFSDAGDSGSLIVDEARRARGLLFSGGQDENGIDLTFANRIEVVLNKLGVTLVT